jgi:hypothetical protein
MQSMQYRRQWSVGRASKPIKEISRLSVHLSPSSGATSLSGNVKTSDSSKGEGLSSDFQCPDVKRYFSQSMFPLLERRSCLSGLVVVVAAGKDTLQDEA